MFSHTKGPVLDYREGPGGYKMEKSRVQNILHPQYRRPAHSKSGNLLHLPPPPPTFNMAKISSYHIKTTQKLSLPPPPLFSMAKTCHHQPPPPPQPFHRRQTPVLNPKSITNMISLSVINISLCTLLFYYRKKPSVA